MTDALPPGGPRQLFIDGAWRDSDGGTFDVLNPATGQALCAVPAGTPDDMRSAIDAASQALAG